MTHDSAHARKLRAAHVLVDALVAVGEAQSHQEVDREVLLLALGGFKAHDLVRIERGPDGEARLDVTPLIYGSLDLLIWLARTLADHAGVETLEVLTDLRQIVTDWQKEAGLSDGAADTI